MFSDYVVLGWIALSEDKEASDCWFGSRSTEHLESGKHAIWCVFRKEKWPAEPVYLIYTECFGSTFGPKCARWARSGFLFRAPMRSWFHKSFGPTPDWPLRWAFASFVQSFCLSSLTCNLIVVRNLELSLFLLWRFSAACSLSDPLPGFISFSFITHWMQFVSVSRDGEITLFQRKRQRERWNG